MKSLAVPVEPQPEYARLLRKTLPAVIRTEEQNEFYLGQVNALLEREDSLSPAERKLLDLLALLIEDFEDRQYPLPKATPVGVLEFLMDQHGLKQKDLVDVFGAPSIVSEVLSGKRQLNKDHIKRLSKRFRISPALFF